jgi:hypothetical protein
MKILLHACCAACTIGPWEDLTGRGHGVTAYFFNPNVHPFIEFRRRLKSMKVLQERLPVEVIYEEEYGLGQFLRSVRWRGEERTERCADCYRLRLERAAREAAGRGMDALTTTLLGSTQQDVALIERVGRECAAREGVEFLGADWRPLAEEAHERARRIGLYLQSYCGCVFSEWERFRDTSLHVYRGGGPAAPSR